MRILFKILVFSWLLLLGSIGVLMFLDTPGQIKKDKEFINEKLKPSVDFINAFKLKNKRLPTNREYYTWRRNYHNDYTSDLTEPVDSLISPEGCYIRRSNEIVVGEYGIDDPELLDGVDWSKNYAIGIWRGEWNEYYFSWTDSYYGNNYSWFDGFIGLLIMVGIGIIPLLIWRMTKIKKYST